MTDSTGDGTPSPEPGPGPDPTAPVPPLGGSDPVTPPSGTPAVGSSPPPSTPPPGGPPPLPPVDGADGEPPQGDNRTWWWVAGIAVLVLLIVAIVALIVRDDGDDEATVDTTTTTEVIDTTTTEESTTTTEAPTTTTTQPPREISGNGNRVVELSPALEQGDALTITHDGSGDFSVRVNDDDDPLVDSSGDYEGTVVYLGEDPGTSLDVTAEGSWTITIQPSSQLEAWDPTSGSTDGEGDGVVRLADGTGSFTVDITNEGDGTFTVTAVDDEWKTEELVDEDGDYSGSKEVPSGTVLIEVRSEGTWTLEQG